MWKVAQVMQMYRVIYSCLAFNKLRVVEDVIVMSLIVGRAECNEVELGQQKSKVITEIADIAVLYHRKYIH